MAHQWVRVNINASSFPLATELWGQSVMTPQQDENYEKVLVSGTDLSQDKGIPQAYYLHNCMPTAQGYQAIGYDNRADGLPGVVEFDEVFQIQTPDLSRYLFSPSGGLNYFYNLNLGGWVSVDPWPPGTILSSTQFTSALIHAQTYIGISNIGIFIYDPISNHLVQQVISGGTGSGGLAGLLGVCTANGYGIYWNSDSVVWSSTTDPLDIAPSLIDGAGGGFLNEAKGKILICLPISGGFLVYCEKNTVAAKYSGNIGYPFVFKEVEGSAGVLSEEVISWQSNQSFHYAWTTAGLMQLDLNNAQLAFPHVTEFIAKKIYEDFDEATLTLTSEYIDLSLNLKLALIEETFLVISYGIGFTDFTYALVYDLGLGRWGKLKITHKDCFQWNSPGGSFNLTYGDFLNTSYAEWMRYSYADLFGGIVAPFDQPRKTLAFLQEDGTVKLVNFDLSEGNADGVLILGKFQNMRNKRIQHQRTKISNRGTGIDFNLYIILTQDGQTWQPPITPTLFPTASGTPVNAVVKTKEYGRVCEGENYSLLLTGSFNAVSIQTDYTNGGQT